MAYNPLFGLHVRLSTPRRLITIPIIVIMLCVLGTGSVARMSGKTIADIAAGTLAFILLGQAIFIAFQASGLIRKALLTDFTSGMIESHRLSPVSGWRLALGYLTGATLPATTLFATGAILGLGYLAPAAGGIGVSYETLAIPWLSLQVGMLSVGLMIGALALLAGVSSAGKANVIGWLVVGGFVGGYGALIFVPGLGLASGGYLAETIFASFRGGALIGTAQPLFEVALMMMLQLTLAALFIAAAARKIRAPESPAFAWWNAVAILLVAGAALVIGGHTHPYDGASREAVFETLDGLKMQLLCSTVVWQLVSLLLTNAAVGIQLRRDVASMLVTQRRSRLPVYVVVPVGLTVLACILFSFCLRWDPEIAKPLNTDGFLYTALPAVFLIGFVLDFVFLYLTRLLNWSITLAIMLLWIVLRGLPLILEGARVAYLEVQEIGLDDEGPAMVLSGGSPIGTLYYGLFAAGNPWPGLIVQAGLAAAIGGLAAWRLRHTRNAYAAQTARPPGLSTQ